MQELSLSSVAGFQIVGQSQSSISDLLSSPSHQRFTCHLVFFPDDNKYFLCLLLKSSGAILCTVTVTFHLHNGVLRDVLAAGIFLRFAPRFVVIVTRDEHHGAPLEPLEGPTLPFLRISVDVCLEICIERSKVGVLVRL